MMLGTKHQVFFFHAMNTLFSTSIDCIRKNFIAFRVSTGFYPSNSNTPSQAISTKDLFSLCTSRGPDLVASILGIGGWKIVRGIYAVSSAQHFAACELASLMNLDAEGVSNNLLFRIISFLISKPQTKAIQHVFHNHGVI